MSSKRSKSKRSKKSKRAKANGSKVSKNRSAAKSEEKKEINYLKNIKSNLLFFISAAMFFLVNVLALALEIYEGVFGVIAAAAVCVFVPDVFGPFKRAGAGMKLLSLLSACGAAAANILPYAGSELNIYFVGICTAATAIYALAPMAYFFEKAREVIKSGLNTADREEKLTLAAIFVFSAVLIGTVFYSSPAFCEYTGTNYNIVYTSNTSSMLNPCGYLTLRHAANDMFRPLFAVFAAPFTGAVYLITMPFGRFLSVRSYLLALIQSALLEAGFYLLSRLMLKDGKARCAFMMFCMSAYAFLLADIVMDQYIISFFWLIFFIYTAVEKKERSTAAYAGAAGTLAAGGLNFWLLSEKNPIKNFDGWLEDILAAVGKTALIFLLTGQAGVVFGSVNSRPSGNLVPMYQRVIRYTHFLQGVFVFSGEESRKGGYASWRAAMPSALSIAGIIIIILCIAGFMSDRKDKFTVVSGVWAMLSLVVMVLFGFGAAGNGMIMYSLYFGWAFIILACKALKAAADKLKLSRFLPQIYIAAAVFMAAFNIPELIDMVGYISDRYPR